MKAALLSVFTFGCFSLNAGEINKTSRSNLFAPIKTNGSKDITEGGFFFHIGGFLPGKGYMIPKGFTREDINDIYDNPNISRYKLGVDFELGNMFRLADLDGMAIGLRTTWFGANLATRRYNDTIATRTISATGLRVGPYFSFELADKMALDVFYQIGPRYAFSLTDDWSNWNMDVMGFTQEIGVGFRLDMLSFILGYNFGSLTDYSSSAEMRKDPDLKDFTKMRAGGLRFAVGIKI